MAFDFAGIPTVYYAFPSMEIPSEQQIATLPQWAQVAFGARCARRLWTVLDLREMLRQAVFLNRAINYAEAAAERGFVNVQEVAITDGHLADALMRGSVHESIMPVVMATKAAISAAGITASSPAFAQHGAKIVHLAAQEVVKAEKRLVPFINQDFRILGEESKLHGWNDTTPVPPYTFSVHAHFFVGANSNESGLLPILSRLDGPLIKFFTEEPARIHELTSSEFEIFVGELVAKSGFHVELSQRTRDGGFDIFAVSHRSDDVKYLIEAKHYGEAKKVGVAVVRQLVGAIIDYKGTKSSIEAIPKGLVATSSRFTLPAKQYMERNNWLIEGADFDRLVNWLRNRERLEMAFLTDTSS